MKIFCIAVIGISQLLTKPNGGGWHQLSTPVKKVFAGLYVVTINLGDKKNEEF